MKIAQSLMTKKNTAALSLTVIQALFLVPRLIFIQAAIPVHQADQAVFPAEVPVVSAVGPAAVLFSIQTLKGFVLGGN